MKTTRFLKAATMGCVALVVAICAADAQAAKKKLSERDWDTKVRGRYTLKRSNPKLASIASVSKAATVIQAGEQPPGFGKTVELDEVRSTTNEVLITAFVNSADDFGIKITGLRPGDRVKFESARGLATFAGRDKIKKALSGFAGVVSSGIGAAKPETAKFLKDAQKAADALIELIPSRGKSRDAFGKEPGSGYKRKEGGVLFCLPLASGVYYAGELKKGGKRLDSKLPGFVKDAFFPIRANIDDPVERSHNTRTVRKAGSLFLVAWDSNFKDNQGVYEVDLRITFAGSNNDPVPLSVRPDLVRFPGSSGQKVGSGTATFSPKSSRPSVNRRTRRLRR